MKWKVIGLGVNMVLAKGFDKPLISMHVTSKKLEKTMVVQLGLFCLVLHGKCHYSLVK